MNPYHTFFADVTLQDMTSGALIGSAKIAIEIEMHVMHWEFTIPTSADQVTAYHIHMDSNGSPGPVAIPLHAGYVSKGGGTETYSGESSTSGTDLFDKIDDLLTKGPWLMIHTEAHPAGAYAGRFVKS